MSLIERIFGKKVEIPLQTSVEFNELSDWIETESSLIFSELRSHILQKYNGINMVLEDISMSRDQLIDAKFGEQVYVRMAKAGASNRDNLVKNLNIIIERITVPEDADPSAASEFFTNAKSIIENSLENAVRSQQYVKTLFPEEFKSVLFDLKHLDTVLDELMLPINDVKDKLKAYKRLPEEIVLIDQIRQQIEDKKNHISELEKKHESLKNDLPDLESKLNELEKSTEFIKAQELKKQVKTLEDQISGIDSNTRELFAPLSKALSRVQKQDESGRHTLSSGNRKILKMLINNPILALKTSIAPFLTELKIRVEDGSLGLKQQKQNKTLEQINKLLGSDILQSFGDQRDSKSSELVRLSEELKRLTVYKEKTQLKQQISDSRGKIDSTNHELDDDRQDMKRLTEEVKTFKTELNSNLSYIFERDIEVVY